MRKYLIIILLVIGYSQDTIHVSANLLGNYKELPILGGNLKPSIQPPWDQEDFLEQLSMVPSPPIEIIRSECLRIICSEETRKPEEDILEIFLSNKTLTPLLDKTS